MKSILTSLLLCFFLCTQARIASPVLDPVALASPSIPQSTFCDSLTTALSNYATQYAWNESLDNFVWTLNNEFGWYHYDNTAQQLILNDAVYWYGQINNCGLSYPNIINCTQADTVLVHFYSLYPQWVNQCSPAIWAAYLNSHNAANGSWNSPQEWQLLLNTCNISYPVPDTPQNICDSLTDANAVYSVEYPNGSDFNTFVSVLNSQMGSGHYVGGNWVQYDINYWRSVYSSCGLSFPSFINCSLATNALNSFYSAYPQYQNSAPGFLWANYLNQNNPANGRQYTAQDWATLLGWCNINYPAPDTLAGFCDSLQVAVTMYNTQYPYGSSGNSLNNFTNVLNGALGYWHYDYISNGVIYNDEIYWYGAMSQCGISCPVFINCSQAASAMNNFYSTYPQYQTHAPVFLWVNYLQQNSGNISNGNWYSQQDWKLLLNCCGISYPTPDTLASFCDSLRVADSVFIDMYPSGSTPYQMANTFSNELNFYGYINQSGQWQNADITYWINTLTGCGLSCPHVLNCTRADSLMTAFKALNPQYANHAPPLAWMGFFNQNNASGDNSSYSQQDWITMLNCCSITYPAIDTLHSYCDTLQTAINLYNNTYPNGSQTWVFVNFMDQALNNYGYSSGNQWIGNTLQYWYGLISGCGISCPHVINCTLADSILNNFHNTYPQFASHAPSFIWTGYLNSNNAGQGNWNSTQDWTTMLGCCGIPLPAADTVNTFCDSLRTAVNIFSQQYPNGTSEWTFINMVNGFMGWQHYDTASAQWINNTDSYWFSQLKNCNISCPNIVNCTTVSNLMASFRAQYPQYATAAPTSVWCDYLNENSAGMDNTGSRWTYRPEQWLGLFICCDITAPAPVPLGSHCDTINTILANIPGIGTVNVNTNDISDAFNNNFYWSHYDSASGQNIPNTFGYWLGQIQSCGDSCRQIVSCDSINAAINQLSTYQIVPDSSKVYSLGFIENYLGMRFQNLQLDQQSWTSILRCCAPASIDFNTTLLNHCDTLELTRFMLQYNLPVDSCLPYWVYNFMLGQIRTNRGWASDTSINQLCSDLNACNFQCLPVCNIALTNSCDSINSLYTVYKQVLADEQQGTGNPASDPNALQMVYTILYGQSIPPEQVISKIAACDTNACIIVSYPLSQSIQVFNTYTGCIPTRVFTTAMNANSNSNYTYAQWCSRFASCGDTCPLVCDSVYSLCDSVREATDLTNRLIAVSGGTTDSAAMRAMVFSAYFGRNISSQTVLAMQRQCSPQCDSFVAATSVNNQTICSGGTATLTATSGISYIWSTGDTTASVTASINDTITGTYTVTVTNVLGCTATASGTVTVNPVPNITINNVVNSDSITTLTASGGITYAWSNGDTTAICIDSLPGTYYVTVTNQYGCSAVGNSFVAASPVDTNFHCDLDYIIKKGQKSLSAACSNPANYVPDGGHPDRRPIVYIYVNFHFMQDISGQGNYNATDNGTGSGDNGFTVAQYILDHCNQSLATNPILTGPYANGAQTNPVQYRYEIYHSSLTDPGVYFHPVASAYYNYSWSFTNFKNLFSVNGNKVIDIYLCGDPNTTAGVGGIAEGIGSGSQIKVDNFWNNAVHNNAGWWSYSPLIDHEIAHLLGLVHSWPGNGSCGTFSNHVWNTDNNIMSYNACQCNYQDCQLGIIHEYLSALPGYVDVQNYICTYDASKTVTINTGENVLWNSTRYLQGDVIVQSGATLTITCKLGMAPGAIIRVKAGGTLNVNGGYITNICGSTWRGIYVEGDNTQDQQLHGGARYQGYCYISNGAKIEYAENIGLWDGSNSNTSGGILIAQNSYFVNNRRSAEFMSYHSGMHNLSNFSNCQFTIDNNFPTPYNFYAHISMWDVDGININGCTFSNMKSSSSLTDVTSGTGIITINASFNLSYVCTCGICTFPCPTNSQQGCSFINLYKGIDASGTSSSTNTFTVSTSNFTNCFYGIYTSAVNNFKVLQNKFTIGGNPTLGVTNPQIGLQINSCIGFQVEGNNFTAATSLYGMPVGCLSVNLGPTPNRVYRNTYAGLEVGNLTNNVNWDYSNTYFTGLELLCNSHSANIGYDEAVTGTGTHDGIRSNQGQFYVSAGNCFSHTGLTESDIYNHTPNAFNYWYVPTPTCQKPLYYSTAGVNLQTTTTTNACPSQIPTPWIIHIIPYPKVAEFQTHKTNFLNYQAAYLLQIDGGNSQALQNQILSALPSESWTIYNSLLEKSPYLSLGTIQTVINEGTSVIPNPMLYDIVAANPSLLQQTEIYTMLTEKTDPMPDYFISLLQNIQGTQTDRSALEMNMGGEYSAMNSAADDLIGAYLSDSIVPVDTVRLWYSNKHTLEADIAASAAMLQQGNTTGAAAQLSGLSQTYNLAGDRLDAFNQFLTLNGVVNQCVSGTKSINNLATGDLSTLTTIATGGRDIATAEAQGILNFFYGGTYVIPAIMPDGTTKELHVKEKVEAPSTILSVFPNPVTSYAEVIWQIPNLGPNAKLTLQTTEGAVLHTYPVHDHSGQKALDTRDLPVGLYMVTISSDGRPSVTQKLIVSQ